MQWRRSPVTAAALFVLAGLPSACSSDGGEAQPGPTPAVSDGSEDPPDTAPSPGPASEDATAAPLRVGGGQRPTVSWAAVDGAVGYRLTVLPDDGQPWAWEGADTSVVLGGGEQDGDGLGFRLTSAAVITVTAHGDDGEVLRLDQARVPEPTG